MQRNPDIEIEPLHIPSSYEEKIATMIAGGAGPDIMFFQDEPFPAWVRRGVFEDLSGRFAKDPSIRMNDFLPQTREYFQYQGRQWTLPAEGGPITWYYNKTLFHEAGLPLPHRDWTIQEWLEDVKKLTRDKNGDGKPDVYGVSMPGGWVYNMPWVWTFGAKYLDVNLPNREVAMARTNTPEFVEAMKFLQDVRHVLRVHGGNFNQGTAAMKITGPWDIAGTSAALAAAGFEWDLAYMPIGPRGDRATRQSFDTWAIWSGSKYKDEAYRFVSFALSPDGQRLFSSRAIPARFSALRSFVHPETPWHEEVFVDIMERGEGWMQPTIVLWEKVNPVLDRYVNQVLNNQISPQEAAERMYIEANGLLKELWPKNWQESWERSNTVPKEDADALFALDRQIRSSKKR